MCTQSRYQLLSNRILTERKAGADRTCSGCCVSGNNKPWNQRLAISHFHNVVQHPKCAAASNGIVIATEKKSPSILVDSSMVDRVAVICPNIGIVYSGMGPDF